jgi:DNA (cytosine-5)-methyltransferase 1
VRGAASVIHPTERRKFTIAELKRICAFPDDFVLTGTFAQQWERLGRAVPPPVACAVAVALRDGPLKVARRGRQARRKGAR